MASVASRLAPVLLLAVSALSACRQNDDPDGAKELLARVEGASFRTWRRAPGYEQRRTSQAPHGDEVDIYVDPTLAAALARPGTTTWPLGSVIVKEGWDGDERELVAVMEKREDGWYWAEYDGDGEPLYSGRPSLCVDCHASGADQVRAFGFPR